MSSISSNSTYNGFHIIGQNYYDFAPLAGSTLNQNPSLSHLMPGRGANAYNSALWKNLMTTQQNLFAGWNGFCGCPSARPQPKAPCQQQAAPNCNRKPVDIHIHHHFYKNSCGGPFTAQGGQGSSSVGQNFHAFGSHSGCSNWSNLCKMPCFSPFSGGGFNFGGYGQYGGGNSVYSNMMAQASFPNYSSYGQAAVRPNYNFGGHGFGGIQAPSVGYGDFGSSYFNGGVGAFGLPNSAYGDFSFGSAFGYGTSVGSMNTMTLLNGALSLLF